MFFKNNVKQVIKNYFVLQKILHGIAKPCHASVGTLLHLYSLKKVKNQRKKKALGGSPHSPRNF